ncbi:hypothetical protein [Halapricum salinum]|uniref:hypothetical protein n=1 Tax=Halapricum salinum TaxID=1457250 RepID=UPI0010A58AF8|nr:hypothetical protein [Halapricum salinum]
MTDDWRAEFQESRADGVAKPRIETHPERDGVRLVDPIEGVDFAFFTPEPTHPVECETDEFYFPVDTAAVVGVNRLKATYNLDVWIRNSNGELVAQNETGSVVNVSPGTYNAEIGSAHLKIYLLVEGGLEIDSRGDRDEITCTETDQIKIGIRSSHEQPAATITTTEDPLDLMDAISCFSSALKTTTCERSFPTLRGHPPLLEWGDSLTIPDSVEPPQTDISIRIPPQYEYLFPVAPLAYYLGATLEPGDTPELSADDETFSLGGADEFEETVANVLKQIFLFDCVTRTEGFYQIDLQERALVEDRVDFDFSQLYETDLAEQIQTYLSVPYETIEDAVPQWRLTADVLPEFEYAETLPFFIDELAIIRCPSIEEIDEASPDVISHRVQNFFDTMGSDDMDVFCRGDGSLPEVFRPTPAHSTEHVFVGEGTPLGTGKVTADALRRRLDSEVSATVTTDIVVVCNDPSMAEESTVTDIYEGPGWIDSDVSIRNDVSTSELRSLLQRDIDFLHYVGHVDDSGIDCPDGYLDTQSLDEVHIESFLLNACRSYHQGRGLVTNGARGGVVTLSKISNKDGILFGKIFAGLLSKGVTLGQSLSLMDDLEEIESEYLVLGDPTTQILRAQSAITEIYHIQSENDRYSLSAEQGFTDWCRIGTFVTDKYFDDSKEILCGNEFSRSDATENEVADLIENTTSIVLLDGEVAGLNSHLRS